MFGTKQDADHYKQGYRFAVCKGIKRHCYCKDRATAAAEANSCGGWAAEMRAADGKVTLTRLGKAPKAKKNPALEPENAAVLLEHIPIGKSRQIHGITVTRVAEDHYQIGGKTVDLVVALEVVQAKHPSQNPGGAKQRQRGVRGTGGRLPGSQGIARSLAELPKTPKGEVVATSRYEVEILDAAVAQNLLDGRKAFAAVSPWGEEDLDDAERKALERHYGAKLRKLEPARAERVMIVGRPPKVRIYDGWSIPLAVLQRTQK